MENLSWAHLDVNNRYGFQSLANNTGADLFAGLSDCNSALLNPSDDRYGKMPFPNMRQSPRTDRELEELGVPDVLRKQTAREAIRARRPNTPWQDCPADTQTPIYEESNEAQQCAFRGCHYATTASDSLLWGA